MRTPWNPMWLLDLAIVRTPWNPMRLLDLAIVRTPWDSTRLLDLAIVRTPWNPMRLLALAIVLAAIATATATGCDSEPTAVDFTVTPDQFELEVGQTVQLSPVGAPGEVHWSSSNSAVASVIPETGFVTAVSRGEVLITGVSGRHAASASIVVRDPPAIELSAASMDFEATRGDSAPLSGTIQVTNAGDGVLDGLQVEPVVYGGGQATGWLSATLDDPAAPTALVLEASPDGLQAGVHTAVVPVAAAGVMNSPQSLSVTLTVFEPASIVLSESSLGFAGIPGQLLSSTVAVTNGGDRPLAQLEVEVTAGAGWLSAQLDGAAAPAELTVTANTTGLPDGQYSGNVRVLSATPGVAPVDLPVTLSVSPGPAIALSQTTVSMGALAGDSPTSATVTVTNSGGGTLDALSLGAVQYDPGPTGWLSAALDGTEAPATLTVTAATGALAPGTYRARVPVTSPVASNSPRLLEVVVTIGQPPQLSVAPGSLTFSAPRQGANPAMQLVNVTNSGGGTLSGLTRQVTYTGGATGWLTTAWEGGSTTAPTRLEVRPITGTLPLGTHTATITIGSTNPGITSQAVTVTFHVVRSFAVDVWPIIDGAGCAGCHFSGGTNPQMGSQSQAYTNLTNGYVVPGSPATSILMCVLDWGAGCPNMPPSGGQLSAAQRNVVRQWIEQGARP